MLKDNNISNGSVEDWIDRLDGIDAADTAALEEILAQIPPGLISRIADQGGSPVREKLFCPAFCGVGARGTSRMDRHVRPEWPEALAET